MTGTDVSIEEETRKDTEEKHERLESIPTTTQLKDVNKGDRDKEACLLKQFHAMQTLRIPASEIAAMAGFHPFRALPLLLHKLVYQGSSGQRLLQMDASLLGLIMKSEEEVWMELAEKAGPETVNTLQKTLLVQKGRIKLDSVQLAQTLKNDLLAMAKTSNKLSKSELKVLKEASRTAVYTGFSTAHEEDALDLYERQCGWEVRERNCRILDWPFIKAEQQQQHCEHVTTEHTTIPTVVPLGEASSSRWKLNAGGDAGHKSKRAKTQMIDLTVGTISNDQAANESLDTVTSDLSPKTSIAVRDSLEESLVAQVSSAEADRKPQECSSKTDPQQSTQRSTDQATGISSEASSQKSYDSHPTRTSTESLPAKTPFFVIRGAVDGIRDELSPFDKSHNSSTDDDDDDSWVLQTIIVECKHRMNKIHNSPPLYEQIQTAAYCLMYDVVEADIVQVMRNNKTISSSSNHTKHPETITKALEENDQTTTVIKVDRISLDDPLMAHRKNWNDFILPRLRLFAEAVYSIRRDDDKRYRLLFAASDATGKLDQAWDILHDECPWLKNCDTSFHRDRED